MNANDQRLVEEMLKQRASTAGQGLSESTFFELFCAEQVLRDDDLSADELRAGVVDGGGDGGVDSFYFFVNDALFYSDLDLDGLKRNAKLRVVMIQSKKVTGFSETALDKLIASAADFFDLNSNLSALAAVYKHDLLEKVESFRSVYVALANRFPRIEIRYAYATIADAPNDKVKRKLARLERQIRELISPVDFSFAFLGASELLELARSGPANSSTLKLAENPISTDQQGFVCLVRVRDYVSFITEESGRIASHMFEGNVRDYQGNTEVNKEIRATLDAPGPEDFWWLNNGVSVICSNATLSAKSLTIENPEIVNGLQTSRELFKALSDKRTAAEDRNVLVRVLIPSDQESRDRIIKATNSQTPIPPSSLRATEKIHRDIEDFLKPRGLFYDRRKNFHKNSGKPLKNILGIPFVAQSVMACVNYEPGNARARPSSLIKSDDAYEKIFNASYPLEVYLVCPSILRRVDEVLSRSATENYRSHKANLRFCTAMVLVLWQCHSPRPSVEQVSQIDLTLLTDTLIESAAASVWTVYQDLGGSDQVAKGSELGGRLLREHKEQFVTARKTASGGSVGSARKTASKKASSSVSRAAKGTKSGVKSASKKAVRKRK